VTHAGQLLGSSHTCWARAHHGYFFARLVRSRTGLDPTFLPRTVNDGVLNGLDAHGIVGHVQGASSFARCGANATRELWKVVGAVQHVNGVFPIALVHQFVEVRNDVVDRAAAVAKRCAAVHAASALRFGLCVVQTDDELFVVFDAFADGLVALFDALKFHETSDFSHDQSLLFLCAYLTN
jgi:hypothetical protein